MFDYYPQEKLIAAYKKWMDIICAVSLFGLIFGRVIARLSFLPAIISRIGRRFVFLFFTNVPVHDLIRNYGPFTEPSRFQAFICLALIFELFNNKNNLSWKRVVLYLVTLVTTFSATAFIAMSIIAVGYFTSKEVNLGVGKRVALIILVLGIAVLLIMYSSGVNIAMTKFRLGEKSESFTVRVNSIVGGVRVALSHPLFGTGFGGYENAYLSAISDLAISRSHVSTNTFILYFSKFGVIIGAFFVVNAYKMLRSFNSFYTAIILLVGLFFTTSGISLVDSIVFSSFIFYRGNIQDNSYITNY